MPQVFPKGMNVIARLMVLGLPVLGGSGVVAGAAFYRSDYSTGTREVVEQPVPFSHKHHVAELGIGCQYCHTSAEVSASSVVPAAVPSLAHSSWPVAGLKADRRIRFPSPTSSAPDHQNVADPGWSAVSAVNGGAGTVPALVPSVRKAGPDP